jgi:hypothetical protein
LNATTSNLYADNDVFVQVWVGTDDKLPRMVRAVYRADRARLRNQLVHISFGEPFYGNTPLHALV